AGGVDATRLTQAGEVFGTPQYMSPEQCNGLPLDHRTDIYSLAIILFEMIEGRPPFSAETPMATMLKHVRAKVPTMRHASKETARIMAMGLRKDRGKRIQTAGRFAELIGECIGHLRTASRDGRSARGGSRDSAPSNPSLTGSAVRSPLTTASTNIPVNATTTIGSAMGPGGGEQTGRIVAVALGVAALGLVAVMVFGGLGSSSSDPAPSTTPTADEDEALAEEDEAEAESGSAGLPDGIPHNRALVRINVTGAKVFVDDVQQGLTPCEIKVPVGDHRTHEIRLEKDGYTSVTHNWRPKSVGEPLPPLPDMKPLLSPPRRPRAACPHPAAPRGAPMHGFLRLRVGCTTGVVRRATLPCWVGAAILRGCPWRIPTTTSRPSSSTPWPRVPQRHHGPGASSCVPGRWWRA